MKPWPIFSMFLLALLLWSLTALARVENQRYAIEIEMCRFPPPVLGVDLTCLKTAHTRTNALWNVFYGLFGT